MAPATIEPPQPATTPEVFTLAEAAGYLRVSEEAVIAAARQQGLPGRQVQGEWRFLKAAVQHWLSRPVTQKERIMQFAGAWQDDPFADEMLEEIYKKRGRPMVEEAG